MTITTAVHLNFRGQARDALAFYASAFGGHVVVVTYADAHAAERPEEAEHVMWGQVQSEAGFHVMAYDVPASRPYEPGTDPVFVSVRGDDADEIRGYWKALSSDAVVKAPLEPSSWAPLYGMVTDRFGVTWILDVTAPYSG